jgi:putative glutamine amidotransferase
MASIERSTNRPLIGIAGTVRTLELPFATVEAHTLFADFARCVVDAGGLPVVLPVLSPDVADALLARVDGIVLTGGVDVGDTDRDRFEIALVRGARRRGVPVLGVCRGLHILNVAGGGTLHPHVEGHLGGDVRHHLKVEPATMLAAIVGASLATGSLHHQAVDRVGECLRVVAAAEDGTVEAIEALDSPCLGVQWHPELETGDAGAPLWRWIVDVARGMAWS